MLSGMSNGDFEFEDNTINVTPRLKRRGGRIKWLILPVVLIVIALFSSVTIYVESLWFGSLGFGSRYWSVFGLGWGLFAFFGITTFAILRAGFFGLERLFGVNKMAIRRIVLNKQSVDIDVPRIARYLGWGVAIVLGLGFAFGVSGDWQMWLLDLHQAPSPATSPRS